MEGKTVLLTFGLLSPNKGIEHVIEALPAILKEHPNVVYIVLGATHPHLLAREGESYRLKLESLAEDRGVKEQVIFLQSLRDAGGTEGFHRRGGYLYHAVSQRSADHFRARWPILLARVKAVISTPYWHAQELLAEERGFLCRFGIRSDRRRSESFSL